MQDKRRVTLRSIADQLGLHVTTVSKALSNHPHIAAETRKRVIRQAADAGYVPDPMLHALAAYRTALRPAKFHSVLAWIHPHAAAEQQSLLRFPGYPDYLSGAEARATKLGYRIEQFWLGDIRSERLAGILRARGIEGVVIAPCARERCELRDFSWQPFSAVTIGYTLRWPQLNMVTNDHFRTFLEIVQRLKEAGYRRIGFYLDACDNRRMEERARSAWLTFSGGVKLPLLVYEHANREEFLRWFKKNKCDAVIVGDRRAFQWLRESGAKLPDQVGVAQYALQSNEKVLAGTYHSCLQSGEAAVDLLVTMVQRRERGIPKLPLRIMLDGRWSANQTVVEPTH
jgi:DNA-binding LacI/PurR family transcriptional regulator